MIQTTAHRADLPAVAELLARAVPYAVTGEASLSPLVDGAELYAMRDHQGRTVGAFAMTRTDTDAGAFMDITAAGGLPGHDLVADIDAAAVAQARAHCAVAVRCLTKRPALRRRLERQGWRVAGYVMTKGI